MRIKLDEICRACGSGYWCDRNGCAGDPKRVGQNVRNAPVKKYPWDEDEIPVIKAERKIAVKEKEPVQDQKADEFFGGTKRGKTKQASPHTIRFPQEVLDHFGYKTSGWQKRINEVLLDYARKQSG